MYKFSELKSDLHVIYRSADNIHKMASDGAVTDSNEAIIAYESNFIIKYLSVFSSGNRAAQRTHFLLEHEKQMKELTSKN